MSDRPNLNDACDALAFMEGFRAHGDAPPGSLVLTLADAEGRAMTSVGIDDVPADPPQHERIRLLGPLLRALSVHGLCDGLLLTIGRRGALHTTGSDLAWHDAFKAACGVARLRCLGTFVVTPGQVICVATAQSGTAA